MKYDPRAWLFRKRGWVSAAGASALMLVAHPTPGSLFAGALVCGLGEGIRLWAIGHTGAHTRRHQVEAPCLVTSGPYSLVRHPLYLGNVFNVLGLALGAGGSAGMLLCALAYLSFLYGSLISLEDEFLLARFGDEFRRYQKRVPGLLPRSWQLRPGTGHFSLACLRYEATTLGWLAILWTLLYLRVTLTP